MIPSYSKCTTSNASKLPNYRKLLGTRQRRDPNTTETENVHQVINRQDYKMEISEQLDGNWGMGTKKQMSNSLLVRRFPSKNSLPPSLNGLFPRAPRLLRLLAPHFTSLFGRLWLSAFQKSFLHTIFKTKTRFFTNYTTCAWLTRPDFLQFYFKKVQWGKVMNDTQWNLKVIATKHFFSELCSLE